MNIITDKNRANMKLTMNMDDPIANFSWPNLAKSFSSLYQYVKKVTELNLSTQAFRKTSERLMHTPKRKRSGL
jgi:pullulanase/glycogen debranching enzyme